MSDLTGAARKTSGVDDFVWIMDANQIDRCPRCTCRQTLVERRVLLQGEGEIAGGNGWINASG